MQPLLLLLLKCFGISQARGSTHNSKANRAQWPGRLHENEVGNLNPSLILAKFHKLDDAERLLGKDHPSLSEAIYVGPKNALSVDYSFSTKSNGRHDRDLIPLGKIHVDRDISITRAKNTTCVEK